MYSFCLTYNSAKEDTGCNDLVNKDIFMEEWAKLVFSIFEHGIIYFYLLGESNWC